MTGFKLKFFNKQKSTSGRRVNSEYQKPSGSYKISKTLKSFSGYHGDIESSRSKSHHLTSHRNRTGTYFLAVFLICLALGWFIFQLTATAKVITGDSRLASSLDKNYYEKALNQYLDEHPIYRVRALLDLGKMRAELSSDYPEIKQIVDNGKVGLEDTRYLVIFRKPVAGWKIDDKQYYVDSEGVSFEKNYFDSPQVQILDDSGIKIETGGLVASNRFLSFVGRVVSEAKSRGYNVVEARLPADTTRELDIKLDGIRPIIKMSIDRGVGVQVEDMDDALKFLFSRSLNPEYVDIRVGSKAFYR